MFKTEKQRLIFIVVFVLVWIFINIGVSAIFGDGATLFSNITMTAIMAVVTYVDYKKRHRK